MHSRPAHKTDAARVNQTVISVSAGGLIETPFLLGFP